MTLNTSQSFIHLFCCDFRLTVHNVTGLSPGHQYQFRICAENFYGRSVPCEPTAPIKMEEADEKALRKEGTTKGGYSICLFFLLF